MKGIFGRNEVSSAVSLFPNYLQDLYIHNTMENVVKPLLDEHENCIFNIHFGKIKIFITLACQNSYQIFFFVN